LTVKIAFFTDFLHAGDELGDGLDAVGEEVVEGEGCEPVAVDEGPEEGAEEEVEEGRVVGEFVGVGDGEVLVVDRVGIIGGVGLEDASLDHNIDHIHQL